MVILPTTPNVSFLIQDEHGNERRMTKQEKKELKLRIKLGRKEEIQKRKAEQLEQESSRESRESKSREVITEEDQDTTENDETEKWQASKTNTDVNDKYFDLKVNATAIEEEIADLRGDRDGVPPVALMPSMINRACHLLSIDPPDGTESACWLDDDLSREWAAEVKTSLQEAEEVRKRENLRPMAYQLVPEVWSRMRPETLGGKDAIATESTIKANPEVDFSWIPVRRRIRPLDFDKDIIFSLLHARSSYLYISCGSKFGSDFLLYDGPRNERHAFAGMRVVPDGVIPTPYDLHGYVRGLNTAGKLSLLAKVVPQQDRTYRVAIVDLALEKVLTAPRHAKRAVTEARRDVAKNLAKK
jgi:hypothetical protein